MFSWDLSLLQTQVWFTYSVFGPAQVTLGGKVTCKYPSTCGGNQIQNRMMEWFKRAATQMAVRLTSNPDEVICHSTVIYVIRLYHFWKYILDFDQYLTCIQLDVGYINNSMKWHFHLVIVTIPVPSLVYYAISYLWSGLPCSSHTDVCVRTCKLTPVHVVIQVGVCVSQSLWHTWDRNWQSSSKWEWQDKLRFTVSPLWVCCYTQTMWWHFPPSTPPLAWNHPVNPIMKSGLFGKSRIQTCQTQREWDRISQSTTEADRTC